MMVGDEAYAGARNFDALQAAILDVVGPQVRVPHAQPARLHQARRSHDRSGRLPLPLERARHPRRPDASRPDRSGRSEPRRSHLHRKPRPRSARGTRTGRKGRAGLRRDLRGCPPPDLDREPEGREGPRREVRDPRRPRRLADRRERVVHPAARGGPGRPHDRRDHARGRRILRRAAAGRRAGAEEQRRRLPLDERPRHLREVHERGGGLRGTAHLRRAWPGAPWRCSPAVCGR